MLNDYDLHKRLKFSSFHQFHLSAPVSFPNFIYKNKITYWRIYLFFLALQYQMKKYEYIPSSQKYLFRR